MQSIDYIKTKYTDIIPRSFNTKLDIFLFSRAIRKGELSDISPDEIKRFQISEDITTL